MPVHLSKCFLKSLIPVLIAVLLLVDIIDTISTTEAAPITSIVFEKTVAVNNGSVICGTETMLTVLEGTEIRYCFRVTNTGGTTLTSHTLVDEHLGTILSGFEFSLVPGSSTWLTQVVTVTETIVNTATWTATNSFLGVSVNSSDSVTVNVVPPSIELEKTVAIDNGSDVCGSDTMLTVPAGTNVRYCFRVTNTGGTTLTSHTLVDDHLGTILSGFEFSLVPGSSTWLTQVVTVTETIVNTATWTATNSFLEVPVNSSDSVTVNVGGTDFFVIPQKDGKSVIIAL